eukprot:m.5537 g.5537  ORF g.5537 m.5537 type:complete len:373 (+) comp5508_c0_seq1:154-1272(+)
MLPRYLSILSFVYVLTPCFLTTTITTITTTPTTVAADVVVAPKPKFLFLLGAMKAGTTVLHQKISHHPAIQPAHAFPDEPKYLGKELTFFNSIARFNRGPEFYFSHFPNFPLKSTAQPRQTYYIDATPQYLCNPKVPQRLKKFFADAQMPLENIKFVIVLREETDRMLSHWRHALQKVHEGRGKLPTSHWAARLINDTNPNVLDTPHLDRLAALVRQTRREVFECSKAMLRDRMESKDGSQQSPNQTLNWRAMLHSPEWWPTCGAKLYTNENSLFLNSLYEPQIAYWLSMFPRRNFCLLDNELLRNKPQVAMNLVTNFLDVSPLNQLDNKARFSYARKTPLSWDPKDIKQFFEDHGRGAVVRRVFSSDWFLC